MFYKLSNKSDFLEIEKEFDIPFKYPNLYESESIINGLAESNLPIITQDDPNCINFAIWGLLPENYDDNWEEFQNFTNTLNTNIDDINLNKDIYSKSLDERRCLIVVTGYFTSKLIDGKLQSYHVHLKNHKPFCIAGIYNKINDGFLTCSSLITNSHFSYRNIPNLGTQKPLIFTKKDYNKWLDPNFSIKDLRSLIKTHERYDFISFLVEEDFFDDSESFKNIVNSANYQSIMRVERN